MGSITLKGDMAVAGALAARDARSPSNALDLVVESLAEDGRLVHVERVPERPGVTGELADPLPEAVTAALPPGGLWRHQVEAIDLARAGRSVVIATGTASGKSLCYQLPIAESVVSGLRAGTSLLIYPTKALAQDQLRSFGSLGIEGLRAATYDGDASRQERTWARANANVLLTNPEMLHHGILPHHGKWATFLKRLDYVVVDELHVLRGIFGTHVAHLLRRLRRACALYGGEPTFIFSSATIGEPERLASELCGTPVTAITTDASPCAERRIAIVQPAVVDVERGVRQAPTTEAIRVIGDLVTAGHRAIAFCSSRSQTERVALAVARSLPTELASTVRPYRSGYLASERREIEAELAAGDLRAVVTTSALELGVDIGGLDATVLCGFPGTIASLWQQIGRSGRGGSPSLSVLIAGEDQLDQWFVNHPEDLFRREPPEPVVVNVENPNILDPAPRAARPTSNRSIPRRRPLVVTTSRKAVHRNGPQRSAPDQTGPSVPVAPGGVGRAGHAVPPDQPPLGIRVARSGSSTPRIELIGTVEELARAV